MKKITCLDRVRYKFDNIMSKGTISLIVWLTILSLMVLILSSIIVIIADMLPDSEPTEVVWKSLMGIIDGGFVGGVETKDWTYPILLLFVTFSGLFITSILIGLITTGISAKLESLRKGHSKVIENNHTLIIGWNEKIFLILNELIIANENHKKASIVILSSNDKVQMEEEIHARIKNTKTTKIICRSGNPISILDQNIVSIQTSKSIIILSPNQEEPDLFVIKALLAIVNNPERRSSPYHVVAEINDPQNVNVAKTVGKDEVELIVLNQFFSRLITQAAFEPGISVIYNELLNFDGDEIYFYNNPTFNNKTFKESLYCFEKSTVIGLFKDDKALLNPPMNTVIGKDDKLIVIAEDDDKISVSNKSDYKIDLSAIATSHNENISTQNVLILGWNPDAPLIINELDNYLRKGSIVKVVSELSIEMNEFFKGDVKFDNQKVEWITGDITEHTVLESLELEKFQRIIILSYNHIFDIEKADAITIIALIHLREISRKKNIEFSIVTQILDTNTRELAEIKRYDDFIVSAQLVSLTFSQLSENKQLGGVFEDIFDADGSEIYLKPIENYVQINKPVNFYTLIESASKKNETVIGYRIGKFYKDREKSYGIYLNPLKSELVTFASGDELIVISES